MNLTLVEKLLLICLAFLLYYVVLIVRWILKMRVIGEAVNQFPMDDKHWLKGHLDKLGQGEEGISYFSELMLKYPKACGLYFINFLKPYVVVYHPDTVKVVLKAASRKPTFLGVYNYGTKLMGKGLLLTSGNRWHRNRRLLTPIFYFDSLKHYIKFDNIATDNFLEKLSDFAECNQSFDATIYTTNLTLDIILKSIFSYESDVQTKGKNHFYAKAINQLAKLWVKRQYEPWKHFDAVYWRTSDGRTFARNCELLHDFADSMIKERRNMIENKPDEADKYHDFLDTLVRSKDEDGVGLSDEELRDEINTFTAAGYETTSSAISWALYNLARYPDHQKICQEEIDSLLEDRPNDYLCWNDLQELPYLTMCIKESMRLCGVPFIERELEEDVFIDGKFVPAGSLVLIFLNSLHTNPQIWENPQKFQPERFSKERLSLIDPFSYVPFSAGFRNCLGQAFAMEEIKVILARTLRRFNFTVKENFKPQRIMALTLKSSNGIHLKAAKRKTA